MVRQEDGRQMGQVTFAINGRSYRIGCADGEEPRLRQLARDVGQRVDRLVMEFGQVGEARLMLMAALLAADELLDVRANLDVLVAEAAERLHLTLLAEREEQAASGVTATDVRQTATDAVIATHPDQPAGAGSTEPKVEAQAAAAGTSESSALKPAPATAATKPAGSAKPRMPRIEMPGKARSA